jgi:hypothetical protein
MSVRVSTDKDTGVAVVTLDRPEKETPSTSRQPGSGRGLPWHARTDREAAGVDAEPPPEADRAPGLRSLDPAGAARRVTAALIDFQTELRD